MTRPIFYPELGRFFRGLRTAHGYAQRQVADIAERRKLDISYEAIRGLERGGTRRIDQKTLRAVAALYRVPYEVIAAEVIQHVYGLSVMAPGAVDTGERPTLASRSSAPTTIEEAIADIQRSTARLLATIPNGKNAKRRG